MMRRVFITGVGPITSIGIGQSKLSEERIPEQRQIRSCWSKRMQHKAVKLATIRVANGPGGTVTPGETNVGLRTRNAKLIGRLVCYGLCGVAATLLPVRQAMEAFFPRDSSMCQHSHRTVTKTLTVWRSCRMAFPQAANSTQATSWYQTSITPPLRLAAISKELGSRLQK